MGYIFQWNNSLVNFRTIFCFKIWGFFISRGITSGWYLSSLSDESIPLPLGRLEFSCVNWKANIIVNFWFVILFFFSKHKNMLFFYLSIKRNYKFGNHLHINLLKSHFYWVLLFKYCLVNLSWLECFYLLGTEPKLKWPFFKRIAL